MKNNKVDANKVFLFLSLSLVNEDEKVYISAAMGWGGSNEYKRSLPHQLLLIPSLGGY